MLSRGKLTIIVAVFACLLYSCEPKGDYTGVEYAPNMYHSVAYDPYSQITDSTDAYYNSTPYNQYKGKKKINMLLPVEGTVARQYFRSVADTSKDVRDKSLFFYELHKDSIDLAARILKNPIALDSAGLILEDGKKLYLTYCQPCHGEKGVGDGKVGAMYKGVPNYTTGRYKTLNEGHIFHTITNGRNRMWGLKTTISPEDRWKIVHYVQKLQKGEG